ncbi:MAG: DNA gyrase subunit A [Planctomycetota bacterium]
MADHDDTPATPSQPGGDEPVGTDATADMPSDPRIRDLEIETELRDSYLTYAMSTIMDRALPDVRDGLKPSQRRILVAMNDLNLRPGRKHIKCAKITGDTSGNYHPHGNQVIYPTLVGLAQKWKMRVPLVDPQGNFGSIEGDPPAAERYTEARMDQAAMDLLADIKLDTVDFQPNYDDRLMEPTVLPGKFPNLLINGGMGIAVGMATSLPPHNPTEVFDAITRLIDNPEITLADLMQDETDDDGNVTRLGIKGPDFPTGGVIQGRRGILEAYETGRGRVSVRGVCHVEESGGRQQLVIDQIPYSLMQTTLVEKIVEAIKDERIKDISDVRNESGRNAQTRIVIELKKAGDPAVVENQLYQFTPLQQTFSMIHIALVGRRPRTLTLLELLRLYVDHRIDVIRRRTAHLLREAKKKAHVLEGMIYAVCDIDEVIRIIRSSRTREEAIQKLVDKRFQIPADHPFAPKIPKRMMDTVRAADELGGVLLSRVQAETIGNMRLIQLTGLEIEKLVKDYTELVQEIEGYELILAEHGRVLDIIREDCAEMKDRYGSPRLTDIQDAAGDIDLESLIKEHEVAVTISHQAYAKRVPLDTYRAQGRGGKGIRASDSKDDDFIEHLFVASTHANLLVFTDQGRVFKLKVYELPEMTRTSKGRAMVNLVQLREGERARKYLTVTNAEFENRIEGKPDEEPDPKFLTFVTRRGLVKRTLLSEYRRVMKSGKIAINLRDGDELLNVLLTGGHEDVLLVTAKGMAIRFPEDDANQQGRAASGVKGIALADDDHLIAAVGIPMLKGSDESEQDDDKAKYSREPAQAGLTLLTVTENGYGKRTDVNDYRVQPEEGLPRSQSRGGKGRADIKTTDRNGRSAAACLVGDDDDVVVISRNGQLVRMSAESISSYSRGTQGVRVVGLKSGDQVVAVARVVERDVQDEPGDEPEKQDE